jgi:putative restriction endonuclease
MKDLNQLFSGLPPRHRAALSWFKDRAGEHVSWPGPLPDGTLLVSKAKAIYKPEWMSYALSIRENLKSPYRDEIPTVAIDGSWVYRYFQENEQVSMRDSEYTNRGLMECINSRVPVGVLRQVSAKPSSKYQIYGLGVVTSWDNGFFTIEGLTALPMPPKQ